MSRSKIQQNKKLVRKSRKLKPLKTKGAIADDPSELVGRSEIRKGILRYYGSGIWKGELKRMRRNRV
jgi:hypothetical protein